MKLGEQIKAIHVRQPQIEHDTVKLTFAKRCERLPAAAHGENVDIIMPEQLDDRTAFDVVVLDDQQAFGSRGP